MTQELVPFGKYRGQPIEVMAQDKQYIEWVQQQGWLAEKYPQINTLIINNFSEPSETPDHNRMQGMFLDESFCLKFLKAYSEFLKKEKSEGFNYVNSILNNFGKICSINFEVNAIDVQVAFETKEIEIEEEDGFDFINEDGTLSKYGYSQGAKKVIKYKKVKRNFWLDLRVEIKPCVGDDYPSILRQIRSLKDFNVSRYNILFVGEYNGKGISESDFVKLFLTQRIAVIFLRDVK